MSHDFEDYLDRRLSALERQNRRLRHAVVGLAAFVLLQAAAVVGWLALPTHVQKANKFVAVDRTGTTRVELDATNPDMASVSLYNRDGNLQTSLCENGGNSFVFFFFPNQDRDRVSLSTTADGVELLVKDAAGRKRAVLSLTEKGDGGVRFFDPDGKPVPPKP